MVSNTGKSKDFREVMQRILQRPVLRYCDYVLYGKDGKPPAIIEVKKTSVDPEKGRHRVTLNKTV